MIKLKLKPENINDNSLRKISKKLDEKEFTFSDQWISMKIDELKSLKGKETILKKVQTNKQRTQIKSA